MYSVKKTPLQGVENDIQSSEKNKMEFTKIQKTQQECLNLVPSNKCYFLEVEEKSFLGNPPSYEYLVLSFDDFNKEEYITFLDDHCEIDLSYLHGFFIQQLSIWWLRLETSPVLEMSPDWNLSSIERYYPIFEVDKVQCVFIKKENGLFIFVPVQEYINFLEQKDRDEKDDLSEEKSDD